ncbi:14245_t:CDS:2 [Funneliformis caledonium]|uniref:14245_t:CDS:1 n=1 Tax=Funneliformis caledonium TaxID=1117310 RepID=A0A9N9IB32_9GLOM|nr:14245_t:CDS:2 [Funneliformis caledonium]
MYAVKRENKFKETELSEWSLQPEALQIEFEYSAWKNFVENIANNSHLYNDSLSRKAQEMVSSFEASLDPIDFGRIQSIAEHIWVVPKLGQMMDP